MSKQSATDNTKKLLPKPYKKRKYYILSELQSHNTPNDIWVAFFGEVYDLTSLVQGNRHIPEIEPIIQAAGTSITHWFDEKTRHPRTFVNQNGEEQFYIPNGKYLHVDAKKDCLFIPWWKNQSFCVGQLTRKSQLVRIINTLSDTEDQLQVPKQETIWEILDRYEEINIHAKSYTWKRKGKILNMEANLEDNGIVDQTSLYEELEVPPRVAVCPGHSYSFQR